VGAEWQGLDEVDPECVAAMQRIFAPVLRDLEATASDVSFAIDPRPLVRCGCVLLPPGLTYADVTVGGRTHPDFGYPFATWTAFEFNDHYTPEHHVAYAAGDVQSMAIGIIWRKTGIGGWPLCQIHGSHPLWPHPDRRLGIAVWECRAAGHRVPIGDLSKS
jgi:hypothetical protein